MLLLLSLMSLLLLPQLLGGRPIESANVITRRVSELAGAQRLPGQLMMTLVLLSESGLCWRQLGIAA